VHNIKRFAIPNHWNRIVTIDVGGECPWGISDMAVDEKGYLVVVNTYKEPGVNSSTIVRWLKENTPWNDYARTTFVIDPENKLAMLELSEQGIHCQPARKALVPGTIQLGEYLHVAPSNALPSWVKDTQSPEWWGKFGVDAEGKPKPSPRLFIFDDLTDLKEEYKSLTWDENKVNTWKKTKDERYDIMESIRYGVFARPRVSELPKTNARLAHLQAVDPLSAKAYADLDRRIEQRQQKKQGGQLLRESLQDFVDDDPGSDSVFVGGRIEWEG